MNGLDLFSGIGGISLALEPWVRTIAYCESDRYAQGVLMSRMREGQLDQAPIWDDVRTLSAEQLLARVDIITGGFPCQDISVAGRGAGLAGERSGLFFEIIRLVDDIRPRFVFLENVPAITVRGLDTVIGSFTELGYDCRWTIVSAAELGAPHLRKRWFLLASDTDRIGLRDRWKRCEEGEAASSDLAGDDGEKESLADSNRLWASPGSEARYEPRHRPIDRREVVADSTSFGSIKGSWWREKSEGQSEITFANDWWAAEPSVGRVANGIPQRVDRLRCLGNAVVPAQAREAFKRLAGLGG